MSYLHSVEDSTFKGIVTFCGNLSVAKAKRQLQLRQGEIDI